MQYAVCSMNSYFKRVKMGFTQHNYMRGLSPTLEASWPCYVLFIDGTCRGRRAIASLWYHPHTLIIQLVIGLSKFPFWKSSDPVQEEDSILKDLRCHCDSFRIGTSTIA